MSALLEQWTLVKDPYYCEKGEVTYFYRYQSTEEVEQTSYYVDLELLEEDIEEIRQVKPSISDAELEYLLYPKYENSLNARTTIGGKELFKKVCHIENHPDVSAGTYDEVNGIFGIAKAAVEAEYTWEELMNEAPWYCRSEDYLVLYEGQTISDEGDDRGVIFKPIRIVQSWKVGNSANDE